MTSALLDDIGALVMVAIAVPIATGSGELTLAGLVLTAGKAALFFVIVTFLGIWIFPKGPMEWLQKLPLIRVLRIQSYVTFDRGRYATLARKLSVDSAELGIIFIMFSLGFEESTDNFLASVKRSWGIALFGALGPFVVAYLIADYVWQDPNISLMVGLAMTATAVSVTMVSCQL